MSKLEPIDNGVRRFRPGVTMVICTLILAFGGWLVFDKVRSKQTSPSTSEEPLSIEEEVEAIREEPPPPPSIHPLEGNRRLFLADGSRHRFQELTFTRRFSEQHDHPGAVLREDDPTLWKFVGVPEKEDVYRIFCADPNFPDYHEKNLTYTRVLDDGVPVNDQPPYITLRDDDYCEWKVRKLVPKDHYEVYCLSGDDPFAEESLGWIDEQEDLKEEMVTVTLGENGNPSWFILEEGQTPTLPRRVSHLIVMPRGDIEHLDRSRDDFEAEGKSIFRVNFTTSDDEFVREAADLNYIELVKAIRQNDPVIQHEYFPPIAGLDLNAIIDPASILEDDLFPLIIPLKVALHTHQILELTMENTEFWNNEWEYLDDFQSRLDESDVADGRVYRGDRFTYIFVNWDS